MAPLVYLCHHPQDTAAKAALVTHLTLLERAGVLTLARDAPPGADLALHRRRQLAEAAVLVVLLSPEWLADAQRCEDAQRFAEERPVLPVLYRACAWDRPPSPVAGRQLLGPDRPISSAPHPDDAFEKVATGLRAQFEGPTTVGGALQLARELNRDPQWRALKALSYTELKAGSRICSRHP